MSQLSSEVSLLRLFAVATVGNSTANWSVRTLEMHVTQSLTALTVRTHRGLLSGFESFFPHPSQQLRFEALEGVVEFLRLSADSVSASTVKNTVIFSGCATFCVAICSFGCGYVFLQFTLLWLLTS